MCADKQEPAAVITLVHGTFARGADWATHGSSFCRKLTDNIGSEVEFEQFQWSGANNIKDRKKAADRLASFLRKQRARYPEALQLVIGHSHGGSVVAYLLRGHPLLASTIAGAAFLATPFVYARPREDWPLIAAVTAVAFLLCFCAIVTTALLYGALIMTYEARNPVVGGSLFASAIILWVIIVIVVRRAARSNRMAQRHNIDQLAEYISTARLPKGKYFFMKGTGDEAASALGAAQLHRGYFRRLSPSL